MFLYKIRCICKWRTKPLSLVSKLQFRITLRCNREKFLTQIPCYRGAGHVTCFFTNYVGINVPCKNASCENASCKKTFFLKNQHALGFVVLGMLQGLWFGSWNSMLLRRGTRLPVFFTNYIGINAPCKNASCKKNFFLKKSAVRRKSAKYVPKGMDG